MAKKGVNKAIIVGNLGQDPDSKMMNSGDIVTNISVATSESWQDKNTGEKKETTEWHKITFYRKLAEIAQKYLKKGSRVYIEGKLQTRKWQDKNGNDRYTTEIIAHDMQMLDSRSDSEPVHNTGLAPNHSPQPKIGGMSDLAAQQPLPVAEDDIPF